MGLYSFPTYLSTIYFLDSYTRNWFNNSLNISFQNSYQHPKLNLELSKKDIPKCLKRINGIKNSMACLLNTVGRAPFQMVLRVNGFRFGGLLRLRQFPHWFRFKRFSGNGSSGGPMVASASSPKPQWDQCSPQSSIGSSARISVTGRRSEEANEKSTLEASSLNPHGWKSFQ